MKEFAQDASGQRAQLRAERGARGEPDLAPAQEWCVVAYRLETAGHPSGAADAWREALSLQAGLPQALLGLGRALLALGDGDGAAESCRKAVEADLAATERGLERLLDDPDEDPWYCIGLAEHLRGRLEEAIAAYARSAERYPWFPEPLLEMARAEMARGNAKAAEDAARRALKRSRWRPDFEREVQAVLKSATGGSAS